MKKIIVFLLLIILTSTCGSPEIPHSKIKQEVIDDNKFRIYNLNFLEKREEEYEKVQLNFMLNKDVAIFTNNIQVETLFVIATVSSDTILETQFYERYLCYRKNTNKFIPDNRMEYNLHIASMYDTVNRKNTLLYLKVFPSLTSNYDKTHIITYRTNIPVKQDKVQNIRLYNVQPGDTWESISKEFNCTVESLKYINPGKTVPSGTIRLF